MKKTLKRKNSTTNDDDDNNTLTENNAKKLKQSSKSTVKQSKKLTTNAAVTSVAVVAASKRTPDDYETMPLDIKLMLERYCCKAHDVIWDPFVCEGFAESYMRHLGYKVYQETPSTTNADPAANSNDKVKAYVFCPF